MIKSIRVTNYLGESILLELYNPKKSGLFIANCTGLGPATADINISNMSTDDGGVFNSARVQSRNIVLTLGYMEKPTIEHTRHATYKYFPIRKKVKLEITTDLRVSEIFGYVETNEAHVFAKEAHSQISIICPDPYFYSKRINNTVFSGVDSMFEFPFSNESLTESLIIFGDIRVEQEQTVFYDGDAEVGIQIHIHALDIVSGLTIYNINTRETMTIDDAKLETIVGSGIRAGDDILITTTKFSKTITLLRDGQYYNILNCLDRYTDWFTLVKGDNIFVYSAEVGTTNLQFRITNQIAYEGV